MGVKRHGDKWQIDLRSRYVKVVADEAVARRLFESGMHMLDLGKPLDAVIDELRGTTPLSGPTFDAYFDTWLAMQKVESRSRNTYRVAYGRAKKHLGAALMADADAQTLKRLVRSLSGYSPHSVRATVMVVKAMLQEAHDDRIIPHAPPRRVKNLPKAENLRLPIVLTRAQHEAIVAATPEPLRTAVAIWPYVGLRRAEMAALRFSDFDLTERTLHVRRQRLDAGTISPPKYGKGRRPRYVDLVPHVVREIEAWRLRNPSHLIVPGIRSEYIGYTWLRETVSKAGKAAGLDDLHMHDFRHTFGSWLLEAGCPVPYVAGRLGDGQAVLLKTYAHEIERAERRAPALFEQWLNGDSAGTPDSGEAE